MPCQFCGQPINNAANVCYNWRCISVYKTVQNMYPWPQLRTGEQAPNPTNPSLKERIKEASNG